MEGTLRGEMVVHLSSHSLLLELVLSSVSITCDNSVLNLRVNEPRNHVRDGVGIVSDTDKRDVDVLREGYRRCRWCWCLTGDTGCRQRCMCCLGIGLLLAGGTMSGCLLYHLD